MSKSLEKEAPELTGASVRAERNSHTPIVTQPEMATKLGWYVQSVPPIENGEVEVTQDQLRAMIAAVREVVAERQGAEK